ncbi:MAG: ROK family protein [Chthoniobacterales bacterium]|nr:ROK family protein [Chthoniobacterales bacterium]
MKKAIGIDFGGTSVKPGVVLDGKIVEFAERIPTRSHEGAESLLAAVLGAVEELRAKHPEVCALGAGLPGIVDSVQGRVGELTNVPGWKDVCLTKLLEERTGLPAAIDNDANAMTYAEWLYGAGRDAVNVVCVTLGTGVGGGLILDGKLFRGSQLGAGEIGQMTIDPHGVRGHYGNFGALEKYVGNNQIGERAQQLYREAGLTKSSEECDPLALQNAADGGDAIARKVWAEVGFNLGITLCDIVWLLNPDRIVLGGGVARAGEYVFGPIRELIRERTMRIFHERLEIVPAALGNDAGIIGSAALALEKATAAARA